MQTSPQSTQLSLFSDSKIQKLDLSKKKTDGVSVGFYYFCAACGFLFDNALYSFGGIPFMRLNTLEK